MLATSILKRGRRAVGKIAVAAMVVGGVAMHPGNGLARDLVLTPDQVFSLWTNINRSLLATSHVVSDDAAWQAELAAQSLRTFHGKRPADVLVLVRAYRDKLDRLRRQAGLAPVKRLDAAYDLVTPSVVYIASGHVLNGQVEWLIRITAPNRAVTAFYQRHDFDGNTPSDVFALVELAGRRLDRIMASTGS